MMAKNMQEWHRAKRTAYDLAVQAIDGTSDDLPEELYAENDKFREWVVMWLDHLMVTIKQANEGGE